MNDIGTTGEWFFGYNFLLGAVDGGFMQHFLADVSSTSKNCARVMASYFGKGSAYISSTFYILNIKYRLSVY